jgi:hypothetical protein
LVLDLRRVGQRRQEMRLVQRLRNREPQPSKQGVHCECRGRGWSERVRWPRNMPHSTYGDRCTDSERRRVG